MEHVYFRGLAIPRHRWCELDRTDLASHGPKDHRIKRVPRQKIACTEVVRTAQVWEMSQYGQECPEPRRSLVIFAGRYLGPTVTDLSNQIVKVQGLRSIVPCWKMQVRHQRSIYQERFCRVSLLGIKLHVRNDPTRIQCSCLDQSQIMRLARSVVA